MSMTSTFMMDFPSLSGRARRPETVGDLHLLLVRWNLSSTRFLTSSSQQCFLHCVTLLQSCSRPQLAWLIGGTGHRFGNPCVGGNLGHSRIYGVTGQIREVHHPYAAAAKPHVKSRF